MKISGVSNMSKTLTNEQITQLANQHAIDPASLKAVWALPISDVKWQLVYFVITTVAGLA